MDHDFTSKTVSQGNTQHCCLRSSWKDWSHSGIKGPIHPPRFHWALTVPQPCAGDTEYSTADQGQWRTGAKSGCRASHLGQRGRAYFNQGGQERPRCGSDRKLTPGPGHDLPLKDEGKSEKEWRYLSICMYLIHFTIYLILMEHCKSIIIQ